MQNVLIYNTFHSVSQLNFEGVKCWIPDSEDAQSSISYLKKEALFPSVFTEKNKFDSSDLTCLEVPRFSANKDKNKKLLLYAQSDTIATSFLSIYEELKKRNAEVLLVVPRGSSENAEVVFREKKLPFAFFETKMLKLFQPDAFVVFNDWTKEVHRIFAHCKKLKIPTVCIQESIIDFGDNKIKRMQWADNVLIQGVHTIKELKRKSYYVTGNPRYNYLSYSEEKKGALINSNFTYGIFEEVRDSWLSDIKKTLEDAEIPFFISQHPRDKGDISKYGEVLKSNAQKLPEMIQASNFVVTRFSSLVHEALCCYSPVIYYNPHGEGMQYDFEFNDSFLLYATNLKELELCVRKLKKLKVNQEEIRDYLNIHCLPYSSVASDNIANVLVSAHFQTSKITLKDRVYRVIYQRRVLGVLKTLKKILSSKNK